MLKYFIFSIQAVIFASIFLFSYVYATHNVGFPVNHVTIGDIWTKTASDGRVIQWIEILAPASVNLDFRYCDAQTCGTSENYDCTGNKWIPQFAEALPQSLRIPPLPGSYPQKIFIKTGPAPGFPAADSYYDNEDKDSWNEYILSDAPQVDAGGNVTLNFSTGYNPALGKSIAAFPPRKNGLVCGLDKDAYEGFRNTFGDKFDNSYRQYYKIAIVWSKPSTCCAYNQDIEFNGGKRTNLTGWSDLNAKAQPKIYRQNSGGWSNQKFGDINFGKTGTVPTALASAFSGVGFDIAPNKVGEELSSRGIWQPGHGSDWGKTMEYVRSKNLNADEVNVFQMIDGLNSGSVFLAAYDSGDNSRVVVVTDYNTADGKIKAIDPVSGVRTVTLNEFMNGNPWIMQISKK